MGVTVDENQFKTFIALYGDVLERKDNMEDTSNRIPTSEEFAETIGFDQEHDDETPTKDEVKDDFERGKVLYDGDKTIAPFPSKFEIYALKAVTAKIPQDEIVPFSLWDGECYLTLFKMVEEHAVKEGVNPWDAFAVMIGKMNGLTFEVDDESGIIIVGKGKKTNGADLS